MSKNRIKIALMQTICIICFCIGLTACSKIGVVKRSGDFGKGSNIDVSEKVQLDQKKVYDFGETVASTEAIEGNPQNIGLEYTFSKAAVFESPEEAGIKREQMNQGAESYNLSTGEPEFQDVDDCSMLLCDFEVKNINHVNKDMLNITELYLVYCIPEDEEVKLTGYPVYFSKSKSFESGDSHYYSFELIKGQSVNAQIGWLVDLRKLEKRNLFLCIGFEGDEEYRQYIQLNL